MQKWSSERGRVLRTRANVLRIRANPGSGTVVGTGAVTSHSVFGCPRLRQRLRQQHDWMEFTVDPLPLRCSGNRDDLRAQPLHRLQAEQRA